GIYLERNAVWYYDYRRGDPTVPHAALSSDLCSDGYVNSRIVMSDPELVRLLASELVLRIREQTVILPVDWVVGSPYGSITFSYELARQLGARHGFVEKDPKNPGRMVWQGVVIPARARVLRCEELIVTRGTAVEVRLAIENGNPEPVCFLPEVVTAIWRPHLFEPNFGIDITALVRRNDMRTWPQEECLPCKQGSPRLRPKAHWSKFISK
ncbi:MAG: hypothetical protein AAB650_02225, partial [Patescibacteria group bacterium]